MDRTGFCTSRDGTAIWWGVVGSGPTLVLCDGFACDGFIWPYVIDEFLSDFQIVRWHYRGHGNSEEPRDIDNVSVEDLCYDLRAVLEHLDVDEAILAGHSMGVQVILQYYGLFPEQIQGLIPVCGTYKRPLETFHNSDMLQNLLPYIDRVVDFAPEQLQAVWSRLTPSKMSYLLAAGSSEINARLVRKEDFQPYLEHVAEMNLQVYLRILKSIADHSAETILPNISVPTYIIAAEHDTFTPIARSEEMHAMIPNSEFLVIPSGTHIGPIELPEMVNSAIERFLKNHGLWER